MASTSAQLSTLSKDPTFINRVVGLMIQKAEDKYASVSDHTSLQWLFAKSIIQNSDIAQRYVSIIANRPNLVTSNVLVDANSGNVVTDATDAQILSQIDTDWSMLSGA